MIRRILLLAAALAAAASTVTHWSVLVIAVILYVTTALLARRDRSVRRNGDADQTGAAIVLSVATGIVVLHGGASARALWEVAIVLAVLHGLHLARHVLRILVFRRWRGVADWRNLTVAAPVPRRVAPVAGATLVPIPVWILAPIFAVYDVDPFVYLILGILCLALMVLTLIPISQALLHNLRMPPESARLAALTGALRDWSPEILVHFNARAASAYAINDWMTVLARLNEQHRVVILTVDRQPWHFDTITETSIPLVHLNGAEAIERFVEQVPSLTLALYPRNTSPNKNLLRVPGLYDVYLGHGESDKAEAVNPATRAFDEVWIAGEAARDRYLDAGIGIRAEQLRITGRPQVGALLELATAARSGERKSVVYAPTWPGYYAEDGYSSVEVMGEQVVSALLDRDDLTVIYVPHPALGTLNRRAAEASERIVARLSRAGGHSVVQGSLDERYAALAGADLLIADIGSDLVDFLALDRPYIALNATGSADAAAFAEANPSTTAGVVIDLDSIATLGAVVERALSADTHAAARAKLGVRYLGDRSTPPLDRFLAAVSLCLDHLHATRPARVLPPPEESSELEEAVPE
jgi:hypothetical protein